ncbi:MAG: hypothetical protein LCH61_05000 [Proteobacteria bacterium]|nr:hypothetical protein [Pseudomonadota bacterium]
MSTLSKRLAFAFDDSVHLDLGRAGLELPITVAIISDAHPQTGQLQMQAVLRKNALAPSP